MPKYFDRCPEAMELDDIKPGVKVWQVYGIWPLQKILALEVTSEPVAYKEHTSYSDINSLQAENIVFDKRYVNDADPKNITLNGEDYNIGSLLSRDLVVRNFAQSWNLLSSKDNDNYMFDSLDKAEAGLAWITAQYEANPDLKDREIQRVSKIREKSRSLSFENDDFGPVPSYLDPNFPPLTRLMPSANSILRRSLNADLEAYSNRDKKTESPLFRISPQAEKKPDEDEADSRPV